MEVIDNLEYIIEPGTDYEAVINFFDTVHWSMHRVAGLQDVIDHSNRTGTCFAMFLKDNVPYCKRLKGVTDEVAETPNN